MERKYKFATPLCTTSAIRSSIDQSDAFSKLITQSIARHFSGDWGEAGADSIARNNRALDRGGERILSVYTVPADIRQGLELKDYAGVIWIITEYDRTKTTILFNYEY
jgi:hypothetical protein